MNMTLLRNWLLVYGFGFVVCGSKFRIQGSMFKYKPSFLCRIGVNPDVAKAGGHQRQGAKGAAVVVYCKPLATPDLESSGFPEG
jgi:hypothetical protein